MQPMVIRVDVSTRFKITSLPTCAHLTFGLNPIQEHFNWKLAPRSSEGIETIGGIGLGTETSPGSGIITCLCDI